MAETRKKGNSYHRAKLKAKFTPTQSPLSEAAATDYYVIEKARGVYNDFWENMGY